MPVFAEATFAADVLTFALVLSAFCRVSHRSFANVLVLWFVTFASFEFACACCSWACACCYAAFI